MRLDLDPRDARIICDCLSMPIGVSPVERSRAESIRRGIKLLLNPSYEHPKPSVPIKSHWPTGDINATPRQNTFWDSNQRSVRLDKATKLSQPSVNDILATLGL